MKTVDMTVDIAGVTLKNPVVTVSGTCGFGREYSEYYTADRLGAITVKGLTLEPREGNPTVRVAETPSGMLNSIGLQNPGVDAYIKRELPYLKGIGATVIANIAGNTIADYCRMASALTETQTDLIEVNISCPNVKCGGVAFGTDPVTVEKITAEIKKNTSKPVMVKLSPNVTDIAEIAKAAESGGADALSLINTLLGMRIDVKTRKPVLRNKVGGLSGPAVRPVALRMVWQVRKATGLPIIGMGGIAGVEDALEFLIAGANAVGVGTAMFTNPYAPIEIIDGLERYAAENGLERIRELSSSLIEE